MNRLVEPKRVSELHTEGIKAVQAGHADNIEYGHNRLTIAHRQLDRMMRRGEVGEIPFLLHSSRLHKDIGLASMRGFAVGDRRFKLIDAKDHLRKASNEGDSAITGVERGDGGGFTQGDVMFAKSERGAIYTADARYMFLGFLSNLNENGREVALMDLETAQEEYLGEGIGSDRWLEVSNAIRAMYVTTHLGGDPGEWLGIGQSAAERAEDAGQRADLVNNLERAEMLSRSKQDVASETLSRP